MNTDSEITRHIDDTRRAMGLIIEVIKARSSKKDAFGLIRASANKILTILYRYKDDLSAVELGKVYYSNMVIAMLLRVIEDNLMYDSRAFALQCENALEEVLKQFADQLKKGESI